MFMEMTRMMLSNDPRDYIFADRELKAATQPLLLMGVSDRRQEWQRYNRMVDRAERVLAEGPQAFGWMSFEEQLLESHADDTGASFSPAQILTPALGSAVGRSFQSRLISQSTGVMLAIEIFRRDKGRLPETLDELVGTYLPQVPEDIFNPGRPIGYVKDANAGYVLYSVGSDGDDDGGIEPDPEDKTRSGIGYRYAFQVGWQRGRPVVIRDNRGQPAAAAPRGPDSDWVLVDTRPQPQPAGES